MRTFPVVFTGHVDHGKSTLVARLLLDTGYFPDGKLAELEAAARRRGVPLEISFLLDSFQVERDQAVTIDATRIWFSSATRRYAIIDAPGHREFVRHMVSGAADALAAVVVVDALEGIGEQSRRHALLLPLVGVTRAIVAINKMDAAGFSAARYAAIVADVRAIFDQTGLELVAAVPTVARDGDNVASRSSRMPWYAGPFLLAALESLDEREALRGPVRFPVHDVYRRDEERILVGNVGGGRIAAGMSLLFSPTRDVARVTRIVRFPANAAAASAGEAVGITLDHPIFVGPGDVASAETEAPQVAATISASIFWLDRAALTIGEHLRLRCGTRDATVVLEAISGAVDVETFEERAATVLQRNDIARVTLRGLQPLVVDTHPAALARFALYRGDAVAGGGIVRSVLVERDASRQTFSTATTAGVTPTERARRYGHRGTVIWLRGTSDSSCATLAAAVEAALVADGWFAYVLDAARLGPSVGGETAPDSPLDARRVATTAKLFAAAGCIAIVTGIPVPDEQRAAVRTLAGASFADIFVRSDARPVAGTDADRNADRTIDAADSAALLRFVRSAAAL